MSKLLSPIQIGPYSLSHRVVMAPLTRMRSSPGDLPNDLMREYYEQRASDGGLIITEATPVSRKGFGYAGAPGIYSDEQIPGWKKITDAVHAKGGRIFMQLWHVGRVSHPELQPNGEDPVSASAIQAKTMAFLKSGPVPTSMPRALELHEIPPIIEEFRAGADRALKAGFDGVEIHGANGYLPDQFLQDGSNKRADAYGGPIENRARFLLEVTQAAISVWGADRVAVRLAPSSPYASMEDSDPLATFGYVTTKLNTYGLAYLHLVEPRGDALVAGRDGIPVSSHQLRPLFDGPIIAATGFDQASAEAHVETGDADLVAFGRHFIANPDLPERFRRHLPLNAADRTTFYGGTAQGYTDYPFYQAAAAA